MSTISESQKLALKEILLDAFLPEKFSELLGSIDRRLNNYYVPAATHPQQVLIVINAAANEGWLMELLDKAVELQPGFPTLKKLRKQILQTGELLPADFDPYAMCCLSGEYIMVNRTALRSALRAMSAPLGKRILIVRDQPAAGAIDASIGSKTGKSLSVQLISALKRHQGFVLLSIDLYEFRNAFGPEDDISPYDLAKRLIRLLEYRIEDFPPNPTDRAWARWALDFCDVFEAKARADARPVWIVIDEFNKVLLRPEVLNLVKELAKRVQVTLTHFRLVLIGFGDTFSASLLPLVEEEKLARAVSERDVIEFFSGVGKQRERAFTEDQLFDAAIRILAGLDASTDSYLEELGRRTRLELTNFGDWP